MKNISVSLPFDSTKERIAEATKELSDEIYHSYLGRKPTKEEERKFTKKGSTDNPGVYDLYFDARKCGSIVTTYILDGRRSINFDYIPYRP